MPYIRGESLRDRLRREKQLPVDDAITITQQVARALSHAGARGIVHRDIKPAGFTASDISFTGSTATGTLVATVTGSVAFYTVSVTGMTGSGTISVTIPAAAAVDADNNSTTASTSTDNTVNWVKP
jgi:serine/threonine protein kinase